MMTVPNKPQMTPNEGADFWYYDIGGTPIPVISKNKNNPEKGFAKVKWTKYQTEELDEETFKQWKEQGLYDEGIAIIGGYVWRGKFKGFYLIMTDQDNQRGIDEMFPGGLDKVKEKTLVEQHVDRLDKSHVYFYSVKPVHVKASSGNKGDIEAEKNNERPAIEVKGEGEHGLHVVAPSIHADGHPYEIVSINRYPNVVNNVEEQVQKVCDKFKIQYLDKETKFGYQKTKASEYLDPKYKIGESEGRRPALLVVCNHYFWRRQERLEEPETYDNVMMLAHEWDEQHCTAHLTDEQIEKQVKDAFKYSVGIKENGMMYPLSNDEREAIQLETLSDIEKTEYAGKIIKVKAIIVSNSVAYNVPKVLEAKCVNGNYTHPCGKSTPSKFELSSETMAEFVEIKSEQRRMKKSSLVKNKFSDNCVIQCYETESTTFQKFRVKPIVPGLYKEEEQVVDDKGNKWSMYDIFLEQEKEIGSVEAGKEIEVTGLVIPDPKSQKITLIVKDMEITDDNEYDVEKIRELKKFFESKQSVSEIMNWLVFNFEKYSRIIQRRNVTETTFLTFFSPLHIDFDGEFGKKNWMKSVVMGDSTTGKSESVRKAILLLKIGQIISGEIASIAGLAGAAINSSGGGGWFVEFGVLTLQDKKLLAIDGSHKLGKEEKDKLAETERNGKVEITKAAKSSAWARTRQIKIENPLDEDKITTRAMNDVLHLVHSLQHNFQIQSIARIDLACFVVDDVDTEARNRLCNFEYDSLLGNLSELIRLTWSQNYVVRFSDDAMNEIIEQAILLENKFKCEPYPLLSNDTKYKIAKIASSLACLTCSFNDEFDTVTVTAEHVKYVASMINAEYTRAGLDEIVKRSKHDKIDLLTLYHIIDEVKKKVKEDDKDIILDILQWLAETGNFNNDTLKEQFNLSRDTQLKPLVGYLVDKQIIKRTKTGFTVLKQGIEIGRFIMTTRHSSRSSYSGNDTPHNNNKIKKEGVSLLAQLEELERRIIKDFRCNTCNTTWVRTEDSIDYVQDRHNEGKVDEHEIEEVKRQSIREELTP